MTSSRRKDTFQRSLFPFVYTSLIHPASDLFESSAIAGLVWPVCSSLTSTSLGIKRGIWTFWAKRRGEDSGGGGGLRIHDMRCLKWLWRRHGPGVGERAPHCHWISCGPGCRRRRRRLWYSSAALPQFLEPQDLLPFFAHAHLPKSIDP